MPSELMRTCSDGIMSCLSQWAYDVTLGWFWVIVLLAFSVVIFMASAAIGNKRAFGFASFVGMIGSVWLAIMGLMDWAIASAFILVGLIGIAIMMLDER